MINSPSQKAQLKMSGHRARGTLDAVPLPLLKDQVAASVAEDDTLDGSALMVLLALYRAFGVLDRDQAEELGAMGLTPLQFNILTVLHRAHQPLTMGALAAMLVVKPTNLSGNISTLAARGLIRRELNVSDQRSLLAVITPEGDAFLELHLPGHWRHLERLMAELSRPQRADMVRLLKKLVNSVEAAQDPGAAKPGDRTDGEAHLEDRFRERPAAPIAARG